MTTPDLTNALFEFVGAFFVLNHCRVMYKHKSADGVSLLSLIFFNCWFMWNLYYYPHLDQWLSFWGGVAMGGANILYTGMTIYFRRLKRVAA